jgi:hypothetical protein
MKKIALLLSLVIVVAIGLTACAALGVQGSGVRKSEARKLDTFKSIETQGAYEVEVTCQKPASFEITADDNILPLIQTEVRDGVLHVTSTKRYMEHTPVTLRISLADLSSFSSMGAGDIKVTDIKNDKFEVHSTGAAKLTANGQTKNIIIDSTGAGSVDTQALHAETARVSATGAASVDVYASQQLDVNMSGAGHVTYSGDPKVINKSISGVGELSKKE